MIALKKFLPRNAYEAIFMVPAIVLALGFELFGDQFGKRGFSFQFPETFGSIPFFQPKLFPMEIFLAWVAGFTIAVARPKYYRSAFTSLFFFALVLGLLGFLRTLPDLRENFVLVLRNSAFVWYLALPLALAVFPIPSERWEKFFQLFYLVTFAVFTFRLFFPIFSGELEKIFWCIDIGILLALAFGFCHSSKRLASLTLAIVGFAIGLSYFSKIQRTILVGALATFLILAALTVWRRHKFPRPQWMRMTWFVGGFLLSFGVGVTVLGFRAAHLQDGYQLSEVAELGMREAGTKRPMLKSETNSRGLERFRLYLWEDAFEKFAQNPLAGIGFSAPVVHRLYLGAGRFYDNSGSFEKGHTPPVSGPHNSYLNALARMGIAGLGFLLLHLICGWYFLKHGYYACLFILLGQMFYAIFNVSLEGPIRSFPILLLIGVGLKLAAEKRSPSAKIC